MDKVVVSLQSSQPSQPIIPTSSPTSFSRDLAVGSTGSDVTLLQQTLFNDGDYPQDLITGYFGPLTEAAVKVFQSKYGIISYGSPYSTGYGSVGPKTRARLTELIK
jgi:peptidoglycan hydrolase-like protein with peptidoglycan-binding domain